jgi:ribulose-phosphate 3-epimerase
MEIIPGILEKEWKDIERKIELVKGFTQVIHIDILDGKFADNTTFLDPAPFRKYSSDILFELHMMVDDPIQYVQPFADAGFKRFLGHVEKMPSVPEFVAKTQLLGEVGLAIDGPTSLEKVHVPYEDIDCLLFMTITAGFSGQSFTSGNL